LRIRLLTLEATAVIAPADARTRSSAPLDVQARRSARSAGALPVRLGTGHGGLAEAVRTIDEGAAILAEARRAAASIRAAPRAGTRTGR
jgi:hypothetical protein